MYVSATKELPTVSIEVYGNLGLAEPLIELAKEQNVEISRFESEHSYLKIGDAYLQMSTGLTAHQTATQTGQKNTVLFDLARDYATSKVIAIGSAANADEPAVGHVTNFLNQIGKNVILLKDVAGLVVLRTMCMLANEAADATNQGVAEAESIDTAMKLGVAYPIGPLEWATSFGFDNTVTVLENIHSEYGEERYRCSPWLKAQANSSR